MLMRELETVRKMGKMNNMLSSNEQKKKNGIGHSLSTGAMFLATAVFIILGMQFINKINMSQKVSSILYADEINENSPDNETDEQSQEVYEVLTDEENSVEGDDFEETEDSVTVEDPVTISCVDGEPNVFDSYMKIPVIAANASSTIQQNDVNNDAMLLFDGKDDTSWQEGATGYGIGEYVSFSFDITYEVKYIAVKLGNWKNSKYYYGNAKPKTMTFILGDFTGQVMFPDEQAKQWVELSEPIYADSMRIVIDEVYPGTSWEDTCISEIEVYGAPVSGAVA